MQEGRHKVGDMATERRIAASGRTTSFSMSSSADIENPKVFVPASVPVSIVVAQLHNCKLSNKASTHSGEHACALRQPGVMRLEYGLLKRGEELSVKFKK